MTAIFRPAISVVVVLTLFLGLAVPLAFTGLAGLLFPTQAGGSLVERDGRVVGSALLGQNFASERYFQPRPSATSEPDPENPGELVVTFTGVEGFVPPSVEELAATGGE